MTLLSTEYISIQARRNQSLRAKLKNRKVARTASTNREPIMPHRGNSPRFLYAGGYTERLFLLYQPAAGNRKFTVHCQTADMIIDGQRPRKRKTRQRPVNSNRRTMFSVRSVPRCYKQDIWCVTEFSQLS
jgi:hypothetical protein